jgi:hypothetical protein
MRSKLQDEDKESQDKNTHEAKTVKNVVDQKKLLQFRSGLLRGFI